jgi:hypothetical protein
MKVSRLYLPRRSLRAPAAATALALLLFVLAGRTPAGSGATPIRVEEDWSLTVNQPNSDTASPQVSTQMARAPWAPRFCNLHLNSSDVPTFAQGGLQLQAWQGSNNIAVYTCPNSAIMSTNNELVTWTQYLSNETGQLTFGVKAASSTTWGDFSGVHISVPNASTDLSNYDVSYTMQNSGVTFGANRVQSLTVVAYRIYYSDGSVYSDTTPRVIYSAPLDPALGNPAP